MWGILINSRSKYKDFTPSHICCETWETKTRKSTKNPKTKSRTDCLLPIEQPGKFDILKMQTEVEKFSHWKLGLFLEKQGLEAPQVNSACRRGHAAWLRSHLKATDPVRPVLKRGQKPVEGRIIQLNLPAQVTSYSWHNKWRNTNRGKHRLRRACKQC